MQVSLFEGDIDAALNRLEKMADESHYLIYWYLNEAQADPIFPDFTQHPRFQKVVADLRLDDASLAALRIPPVD
jgi:hypothetical protein